VVWRTVTLYTTCYCHHTSSMKSATLPGFTWRFSPARGLRLSCLLTSSSLKAFSCVDTGENTAYRLPRHTANSRLARRLNAVPAGSVAKRLVLYSAIAFPAATHGAAARRGRLSVAGRTRAALADCCGRHAWVLDMYRGILFHYYDLYLLAK